MPKRKKTPDPLATGALQLLTRLWPEDYPAEEQAQLLAQARRLRTQAGAPTRRVHVFHLGGLTFPREVDA